MENNFNIMLKQCEKQAEKIIISSNIDEIIGYSYIFNNYFEQLKQIIDNSKKIDTSQLNNLQSLIVKMEEKLNLHKNDVTKAIHNLGKMKVTNAYGKPRKNPARKFDSRT